MKRPKNFLLLVVLVSVMALALAAVFFTTHRSLPPSGAAGSPATTLPWVSPVPVVVDTPPAGTPSAAAQKRAKDFNDATNRFNAPDGQ